MKVLNFKIVFIINVFINYSYTILLIYFVFYKLYILFRASTSTAHIEENVTSANLNRDTTLIWNSSTSRYFKYNIF